MTVNFARKGTRYFIFEIKSVGSISLNYEPICEFTNKKQAFRALCKLRKENPFHTFLLREITIKEFPYDDMHRT
jgi:hypothetical protein